MKFFQSLLLLLIVATAAYAQTQEKHIAIIIFKFQDQTSQPNSVEEARKQVFTNSNSSAALYKEMSFGKLTLTGALRTDGDIFGPYTVPFNGANCLSEQGQLKQAAQSMAANDGFIASNYDVVIYNGFIPNVYCGGIGGFGPYIWYPASGLNATTVSHELGHCFGRGHANAYRCTDANGVRVAFGGTCSIVTYGMPFTVMGNGQGHFSIYEKSLSSGAQGLAGWLQPENLQLVSENGIYSITPLEQQSTLVQGLKIRRQGGLFFWMDYRQPFGLENSPYINTFRGPSIYTANGETQYIDNTPETDEFLDGALTVNKSFVDKQYGITITTLAADETQTIVQVTYDPSACEINAPAVSISPSIARERAGLSVPFTVRVANTNMAACTASTYNVVIKVPSQWTVDVPSFSVTLKPDEFVERNIQVTSKMNAKRGSYTINMKATDTTDRKASATYPATVIIE